MPRGDGTEPTGPRPGGRRGRCACGEGNGAGGERWGDGARPRGNLCHPFLTGGDLVNETALKREIATLEATLSAMKARLNAISNE